MDLKQLRTFLHVAETGSFSRAAKRLNVTQPALSRQIRMMEEEAGIALFVRTGRGVLLSEAGERLMPRARLVSEEVERIQMDMTAFAGTLSGEVRLGLPPSVGLIIGATLIERFQTLYPNVRLRVTQLLSGALQDALLEGRMDIGIGFEGNISPLLHSEPLWLEQLYFMSAPSDDLKGKTTFDFAQSLDHPLILPGPRHGLRSVLEEAAAKINRKINAIIEVESLSLQTELTCRGLGCTILSYEACRRQIEAGQLMALALVNPTVERSPSLLWANDFPLSRAAQALRDMIHEVSKEVVSLR